MGDVVARPKQADIPVLHDVDVIVVGGGPGGIGAAVAAARLGARTLLLEQYPQSDEAALLREHSGTQ